VGAYEVLGKAESRDIYDRYGEFGLSVLGKTGSPGLTDFVLNTQKQAWVIFLLILLLLTALSQPFLVVGKLQGWIPRSVPWILAWSPLWIFHVFAYSMIILFTVIAARLSASEDAANGSFDRSKMMGGRWIYCWVGLYPLLVCFTNSVALKADKLINTSWATLFAPYLLFEALYLVLKGTRIARIMMKWPGGDPVLPLLPHALTYLVYQDLRWSFKRLLLAIAVLGELTAFKPSIVTELIFLLMFLLLALSPIADLMYWRAYKFAARESRLAEQLPNRTLTILSFSLYIFAILILMAFLGLVYARIGAEVKISWFIVFMPILVVAGIISSGLALSLPCIFCCCLVRDDTLYDGPADVSNNTAPSGISISEIKV